MYLLMNKDKVVAEFEKREGLLSETYTIVTADEKRLPIGFKNIEDWINNRKGSKHNEHLRKLMQMCGCEKTESFIRITHAATINDTFWVKQDHESLCWNDVSLYRNKFNEVISKLAFEGIGLYGIQLSSTSPELSTEGSFRKCWQREGNDIFLYKRGQTGARNVGLEPYCEMLGAEIAGKICRDAVPYTVVMLHDELASKCKLFTSEDYGYVPIARFGMNHHSPDEMLEFYERIDSGDEFRRMIVLDALTFNVDRHAGNHGVLISNDSLEILRMAPVFDMNLSMLPYVEMEEFEHIGNKLLEYGPRIGDDFTRMGQAVMTSEIRRNLINLKGFEFSFRGDERFSEIRVKILERLVNQQIDALLSKEKLYTKDVFVPDLIPEVQDIVKNDICSLEHMTEQLACNLMRTGKYDKYNLNFEDDSVDLILYPAKNDRIEIHVNIRFYETWMEKDGIQLKPEEILLESMQIQDAYLEVVRFVDELSIRSS